MSGDVPWDLWQIYGKFMDILLDCPLFMGDFPYWIQLYQL